MADRCEAAYLADPVNTLHSLIGEIGFSDAERVVRVIEDRHERKVFIDTQNTIDESAGLDPTHPLQRKGDS